MATLVTGGYGFLGSYLVKELVKRGEKVIAFDISQKQINILSDILGKFIFVKGDVSNISDILSLFTEYKITEVYHLASLLAEDCEKDPLQAFRINVEGTLNLLEIARRKRVNKFIFSSSIAVFDKNAPEPVDDDAPKNPCNVYGLTKLICEQIGLWYAHKYALDFRATRFTWIFGPYRTKGITAFASNLIESVALGKHVEIKNLDEKGDWIYIKDAVRALILLHDAEKPEHRIYNIAGGTHSVREVVEILKKIVPHASIEFKNEGKRLSPYPSSYNDSRARSEIGWHPLYTIEEAIKEHIMIIQENI